MPVYQRHSPSTRPPLASGTRSRLWIATRSGTRRSRERLAASGQASGSIYSSPSRVVPDGADRDHRGNTAGRLADVA